MCAAALRVRNEKHGAIETNPARPRIETPAGLPEGRRFSAVAISKPRRRGSRPKARTGETRIEPVAADPRSDRVERLSLHIHGLASGAAGVCRIRPTTSPAGRAAVLLHYVQRPSDFIGHCNGRLSLSAGGEFRTSKKHRLSLKTSGLRTRTAPLVHVLICRMNPSHHGSDEQVFGAKQQVLRDLPMNGGSTKGNDGGVP
jgi:hypothetical protein